MTIQQHTIDVGIDLGTTNSAGAVVVNGQPLVVPNVRSRPVTPSVVRIRKNGALDVGDGAYQQLEYMPDDCYSEFKRAMGDPETRYTFRASRRTMSPAELSAEVLKALRSDVQQHHGFAPRAAVITVPAAFDLAQCAATQEAARIAGFEQAPLLQEPVAASLAYGYTNDVNSGSWLVYDLGGGTFDLALVGIREGKIEVLDHRGDNFLGGKDLDWAVVDHLLIPRLADQYSVDSFVRNNAERRGAMAILKLRAEELKIALTTADSATATIESGRQELLDDDDEEIAIDLTVSRSDYERTIDQLIGRTIEMSLDLLERNSTRPDSVLLVGGPTLTPYLRRQVEISLGVPIDTSADPLTVVAHGAALFAATQPLRLSSVGGISKQAEGTIGVNFRHATVTDDTEVAVGIQVDSDEATSIQIAAGDGSWRSGSLPLTRQAAVTQVPLLHRGANEFEVTVSGEHGTILTVEHSSFVVYRGVTAAAPPLSRSLGVVIRDEGTGRKGVEWILERGTSLPTRASVEMRTTMALQPGGDVDVLGVYIVEGEARRPERNRLVGRLDIVSEEVTRTIPAGAPVEVRLEMSSSRLLTGEVFFPSTDQAFELKVQISADRPRRSDLIAESLAERDRIDHAASYLSADQVSNLQRKADQAAEAIRAVSDNDPGSNQQAHQLLQSLQAELDDVEGEVDLPVAIEEARQTLEETRRFVTTAGSESQQRRCEALARELKTAVAKGNLADIERTSSKIARLGFEVLAAQPWFWREWFEYQVASVQHWSDPREANLLIQRGTTAISRDDVDDLRRVTILLHDLAPPEEGSYTNVGLRRG